MDLIEWSLIDVFYSTKANYEKKDVLTIVKNFIQKMFFIKNIKDWWTNDDIIKLIYDIFLYHDKRLSIYNFHYIKNIEEKNEYYLIFKGGIQYKNENTDNDNLFVSLYTCYNNRIQNALTIHNDIKERIIQIKSFAMFIMWINRDHCSIICNAKYIKKQQYQEMVNPCIKCQSMELEMLFFDISNICTSYHCKKCQHHHQYINCPFNRVCRKCKRVGHYENKCRYK